MNKILKSVLVLGTVALLSGALLVSTHLLVENVKKPASAASENAIELSEQDISLGITSAHKNVVSGKATYVYNITVYDKHDAGEISFVLTLDSNGAIASLEFTALPDNYAKNYKNAAKSYVGVTSIGSDLIITGSTQSGEPIFFAINQAFDNYRRVK